jgi:glycosyltransferase involved in cell wall biosynthesis
MRVLLVNQHFPPQYVGGSERAVQSLARELAALGDQVSIIARCPAESPPVPVTVRERLPDDSRLYRLRGGDFEVERFLQHDQAMDREFTAAMLERKPEIVHIHHLRSLSTRFIEIAVKLGAAVIISLHDFYFACPRAHLQKPAGNFCHGPDGGRECAATCFANEANAIARWSARAEHHQQIFSLAKRVICYSSYVATYFEEYGVPRSRLRIIPLGISPGTRQPAAAHHKGKLNLAFCGSVVRLKGPHVILDALKLARLGDVALTIFGQTTDAEYVAEMKRSAKTIPSLTLNFHGPYNWADMDELLAGVDCVVCPSQVAETFGMVPREALVRGIPTIVARLGALPEAVREGENGFCFDPHDPRELASILVRFAREPALLTHLARGARATRTVTPASHAQSIRAIYREALESPAVRTADQEQMLAETQHRYAQLMKLGFQ